MSIRERCLRVLDLREQLKATKLKSTGSKAELQNRPRAAVALGAGREDSEEEEDQNEDRESVAAKVSEGPRVNLTFKDVEESLTAFSGDDEKNILRWLSEFEETAETEFVNKASDCPKKNIDRDCNLVGYSESKCCVTVKIKNDEFIILVDTGSDLLLIQVRNYVEVGAPRLIHEKVTLIGIVATGNATLGGARIHMELDVEMFPVDVQVVPDIWS
ncbi:UNVERIFIED_CONTAM: hypothetical protein PYX00_011196 [Menopon gallinae]|uniref:SAP domain-containing protein n=1 Tax=Menopon gallinae TaxID=328185 RepID=A0AAW2H6M0_9NEOP